jgi:hypothetical protein
LRSNGFFREVDMPTMVCARILVILAVTGLDPVWAQPAPARHAPLPVFRMDILASTSMFRSLNRNDVVAALQVWIGTIGLNRGFDAQCTVNIVEDTPELKKRILTGPPGLVMLDAREFLELSSIGELEPVFVGSVDSMVLVAGAAVAGLPDLRDRTAAVLSTSRADLGRKWFESLLQERGLGPPETLLRLLVPVFTPSTAVLPVFFGKHAAAVVTRSGLDVMKELNPQIGARVRVLASSEAVPEMVLCLHRGFTEHRPVVIEAMRDLHLDPSGKQIMLVFRTARLIPFEPKVLATLRSLYRRGR